MQEGQNILALMMKKKRAEGSLDMPVVKKKKKKQKQPVVQIPPQPQKPPTPPPPTPPQPEGHLNVTIIEQIPPDQNQFFDAECKAADQNLQKTNEKGQNFKKKVKKVNGLMARLHASVQEIKSRYNDLDIAQLLSKKPNKKKIAQARAFVKSQVVKKKEFQHKISDIKQKELTQKEIEQQRRIQSEKKQKVKEQQAILKQFQKLKLEKAKQREQNLKKEKKIKEILDKYKDGKRLYIRLEQQQDVKDKKQQEVRQVYLQKRSQKFKPVQFKEIGSHMKLHKEHLKDAMLIKQQQELEKHHKLWKQNLKLLQRIYRGKNYQLVQQEEEQRKFEKLRLNQKRERIKKFEAYVRQNFKPEAKEQDDKSLQQEMFKSQNASEGGDQEEENVEKKEQEQNPRYRKIKRYKFLQGKSCGQIIQTVKVPLSQKLQRRLGDDYLQHVILLPKKSKTKEEERLLNGHSVEVIPQSKREPVQIPILPRPKNYSVRISQTPNRGQLSNLLQNLKSRDQQTQMKQRYLRKVAGNRDSFELKSANLVHDDIISNIQRKLSLLHQL